jgi:hypothetical protein
MGAHCGGFQGPALGQDLFTPLGVAVLTSGYIGLF